MVNDVSYVRASEAQVRVSVELLEGALNAGGGEGAGDSALQFHAAVSQSSVAAGAMDAHATASTCVADSVCRRQHRTGRHRRRREPRCLI